MENIGYYNGKFDLIEKMTVPMNDRAMYFGDGVSDATYSVNRTIFALEDHLDRFYNSCRLLEIPAPMPREELKKTLYECVNKVDDPNQFVYWEATRGTGIRNHVFPDSPCELDGVPVGGKAPEIIKTLQDAYLKRLHDECGE